MTQTKRESLIESLLNIGSGLFISGLIIQPLIFPLFGIYLPLYQNLLISLIFTFFSISRSYLWRRFFDKRLRKKIDIFIQEKLDNHIHEQTFRKDNNEFITIKK